MIKLFFKAVFILFLFPSLLWAASTGQYIKEGNKLYKKGEYEQSFNRYEKALEKNPELDIGNFNAGIARYKQGQYEQSVQHTQKALLSEDKNLKEKAHYNLGNAFYKWGILQEDKDISQAIKKAEESVSHYAKALELDSKDQDARFNQEFVKKELERLKKKQEELKQKREQKQSEQNKENNQQKEDKKESQNDQKQNASEKDRQEKNQEENTGQEPEPSQKEEPQGKSAQEDAKQQKEDYNKSSASIGKEGEKRELTPQEAEMLLKDYQATEEPKGLFKTFRSHGDLKDVEKDW